MYACVPGRVSWGFKLNPQSLWCGSHHCGLISAYVGYLTDRFYSGKCKDYLYKARASQSMDMNCL